LPSKLNAKSPFTLATYDIELLKFYDKDHLLKVIKIQQDVIKYQQNELLKKEDRCVELWDWHDSAYDRAEEMMIRGY
jgi:hypothetical protein